MSLRIDMYLDLPNNPKECIYEEKRDSWFSYAYGVQPHFSNKQDMLHIHSLNNLFQYTYGDNWIDLISFNDDNIRQALKLIYVHLDENLKEKRLKRTREILQTYKEMQEQKD